MSLSSPVRNTLLPLRIQQRLNEMFARNTGFSGPEILEFFAHYDINIEPYPSSGAPSRKQMFEDCLARFDRESQLKIVVDLLDYDGPMKHGRPSAEDVEFVRRWLIDDADAPTTGRRIIGTHASTPLASSVPAVTQWDIFISHASEDKEAFARPLAQALQGRGLRVWFDEFTLRVGDSLRRSIDKGLAHSRFGVVIVSPAFLSKEWPQKELDGLMAREVSGQKVILPVWHNIDKETVLARSPLLADRLATYSNREMDQIVSELLAAMGETK